MVRIRDSYAHACEHALAPADAMASLAEWAHCYATFVTRPPRSTGGSRRRWASIHVFE